MKVCKTCGIEFVQRDKHMKYCSAECRRKAILYGQKLRRKNRKKGKDHIDKIIEELNRYNAENGMMLSYGQYVAKKYMEDVKNGKKTICNKSRKAIRVIFE